MSGRVPTRLDSPASIEFRVVESERVSGRVHGGRLGFWPMSKICKLVRPERNGDGTEVKLLESRLSRWREVRPEREGKEPERWFRWRERDMR